MRLIPLTALRGMAAIGSLLCVSPVFAQTLGADVTGGFLASPIGNTMAGWIFNVTSPFSIGSLGIFDAGSNGLVASHQVGLWNSSGTLIASTTVTNASTPVASASSLGRWLFQTIVPVNLGTGQYTIGALFFDRDPDLAILRGTVTTMAGVSYVQGVQQTYVGTTLVRPTQNNFPGGIFGPSFQTASSVPEPGEWAAMGVLAAGLGGLVLRKRRSR